MRSAEAARLDWIEIGRRALAAAAAALAEAACRRAGAEPGTIGHTMTEDHRATVRVTDAALIGREQGRAGVPPAPFLAPDAAGREAIRAAVAESLRKDLA